MTTPLLTYRISNSGRVRAAYRGSVRMGYVEQFKDNVWLWQLAGCLRPEGGSYAGRCGTLEEAEQGLERSLRDWMRAAELAVASDDDGVM